MSPCDRCGTPRVRVFWSRYFGEYLCTDCLLGLTDPPPEEPRR